MVMSDLSSKIVRVEGRGRGGRVEFGASGAKINTVLPVLAGDVIDVLSKTVTRLKEVLVLKTNPLSQSKREKNAMEYIKVLSENMGKLVEVLKKKS